MEALAKPITRARHLAKCMARVAAELRSEPPVMRGAIRDLLPSLALFDSEADRWVPQNRADLAQLLAYGMFVHHCRAPGSSAGIKFSSRPIAELQQLLADCDLDAVLNDVQRVTRSPDPVAHFFELFLSEHDAVTRRRRGVYYTPGPIVAYIVSSVDTLLRTHFGTGLNTRYDAWPDESARLRIVDPACGCGTFLSAVVDLWRERSPEYRSPANWPAFAHSHLQRMLIGFEILPSSCAVANHLLREKMFDAAAVQNDDSIVRPMNPLDGQEEIESLVLGGLHNDGALVVLGNPPYANFGRQNGSAWIKRLLNQYKHGLHERKQNLNDDFVKFIRWSQYMVDRAGAGIVAMITNNTYLDGLTHRQMRRSLLESFSDIYVLDLHGSNGKRELSPNGKRDENVFGIRQGVSIGLFVKRRGTSVPATVQHAELWGSRDEKLRKLEDSDVASTDWRELHPHAPMSFFIPRVCRAPNEYNAFPRIDEIFCEFVSGVQTKRDALFIGFTADEVETKMRALLEPKRSGEDTQLAEILRPSDRRISERAEAVSFCRSRIRPIMVSPWDVRWVYYEPKLLGRARLPVMRHMLHDNVGLIFMRQSTGSEEYDHFLAVSSLITDRVFYSAHGAPYLAPLFLCNESRQANLAPDFVRDFAARLKLRPTEDERGNLDDNVGPRDIFYYLYAVFHSREFRRRYDEQLKIDFPRLPLTCNARLFGRLSRLGCELARLHLLAPPRSIHGSFEFVGKHEASIARGFPRYVEQGCCCEFKRQALQGGNRLGRIYVDANHYIEGVDSATWQFRLGGYSVARRWLTQRRGRALTANESKQLLFILHAAAETERLSQKIDAAIPSWPIR